MKTIEMLDELKAELDAAKAAYEKKAGEHLIQVYAEFFESAPMIQQFYWTQYTPYFNDGDACVFSVHDVEFNILPIPDGERDYEGSYKHYYNVQSQIEFYEKNASTGVDVYAEEIVAFLKSINADNEMEMRCDAAKSLINSFICSNEDLMEAVYGDHVEVVVTKKDGKITVEVGEYDHY